jgi:hypothetical protein
MAALPVFVTEVNAVAAEVNAAANEAAADAIAAVIATAGAVLTTGDQTVNGTKTFTSPPVLPGNAITNLQAVPKQQVESIAAAAGVPVGATVYFPATAAPSGFIKKNGALLSRTTYAALYAFALASGNMAASDGAWTAGKFSPGDGSTTFRIPDGRAETIRGWDDSRGVDAGRTIGSSQADQNKAHTHGAITGYADTDHTHSASTSSDGAHQHNYDRQSDGNNAYPGPSGNFIGDAKTSALTPGGQGNHNHTVSVGTMSASHRHTIASDGGTEVRVRNVAELACIKY